MDGGNFIENEKRSKGSGNGNVRVVTLNIYILYSLIIDRNIFIKYFEISKIKHTTFPLVISKSNRVGVVMMAKQSYKSTLNKGKSVHHS